jgi:hypothetical protein
MMKTEWPNILAAFERASKAAKSPTYKARIDPVKAFYRKLEKTYKPERKSCKIELVDVLVAMIDHVGADDFALPVAGRLSVSCSGRYV